MNITNRFTEKTQQNKELLNNLRKRGRIREVRRFGNSFGVYVLIMEGEGLREYVVWLDVLIHDVT